MFLGTKKIMPSMGKLCFIINYFLRRGMENNF
jgi:hypothetical protein